MKRMRWENWAFLALVLLYAVYAAVFIWKTSFEFEGERYFALFDDAMISMQFAKNLAAGNGMVWNAGEAPVEGFTNPLWVVFMAGLHVLHVPVSKISLLVQASGGLFFIGALYFTWRIASRLSGKAWVGLLTAFVCAFYYPFSTWSLMGMEVSALLLVVTGVTWWLYRLSFSPPGKILPWVYVVLGISTLVRTDMVVTYGVIWAFLLFFDRRQRKQHLLWGAGLLALCMGGQTLFRIMYYGDPLPNTYYLKMDGFPVGVRLLRGVFVFLKFAWNMGPVFMLLPLLVVLFKRDRAVLLMALLFLGQVAYSIYVGGDAWEHRGGSNRFISLGMPFFFALFTVTSVWLFGLIIAHAQKVFTGKAAAAAQRVLTGGMLLFVALALVNFNTLLDGNSLKQWLLIERNIFSPGSERYAKDGLLIKQLTTPDAVMAVAAAGNSVYFADLRAIDLQGKVDAVIARQPIRKPPKGDDLLSLQPGHLKWDYTRSLGAGKPDVIEDLIINTADEVAPYLVDYVPVKINGHTMYFRKNSPRVRWDKIINGEYKP